jgi:hypothetical protein
LKIDNVNDPEHSELTQINTKTKSDKTEFSVIDEPPIKFACADVSASLTDTYRRSLVQLSLARPFCRHETGQIEESGAQVLRALQGVPG